MIRHLSTTVVTLLLGLRPIQPPPVVLPAYVTEDGVVSFDSPVPLQWDSMVSPTLSRSALDRNPDRRRELFGRKDDFGYTEINIPVEVPPVLQGRHYYLFDSAGVGKIEPTGLHLTVRIGWADTTSRIRSLRVSGRLQAPVQPGSHGGFVLATESPITLETAPSQATADDLLAPDGSSYFGRGTPFREIIHQYTIRQIGPLPDRWIWVQWRPDDGMVEGGCVFRFTLFRMEPKPASLATTSYGCDI